jgi:hypothetical protein
MKPAPRQPAPAATATKAAPEAQPPTSRSEQRNVEARAKLKPLGPGERPAAVTVAAVVALLFAIGNVVAYAAGLTVNGTRPTVLSVAVFAGIMLVAAAGMWRAKYWAVLGFQALLGITICIVALFSLRASSVAGLLVPIAIVVPAGYLFWKLVKALARIQMPESPTRKPPA